MNWRTFWLVIAGGSGAFFVVIAAAYGLFQVSKALEPHIGFLPAFGVVCFGIWLAYTTFVAFITARRK